VATVAQTRFDMNGLLGLLYQYGHTVQRSFSNAELWYVRGASKGSSPALLINILFLCLLETD
jgi:TPR repeat protein